MKSKKLLSMVVAAALVFCTSVPALAEGVNSGKGTVINTAVDTQNVKITKDSAKALALKTLTDYFDTKIDDTSFNGNIQLRNNYDFVNSGLVWDMSWYKNGGEVNFSANVSIDANTGKLLNANVYQYTNGQQNIASITREQARTIGESFLKKLNPKEFAETKLLPDTSYEYGYYGSDMSNYNFSYVRVVNGLTLRDNALNVTVNGVTGKIMGYGYRWSDNVNVPSIDGIITKDKAEEIFRKNVEFKLNYRPYRDRYASSDEAEVNKLIYVTQSQKGMYIDAKTGNMTELNPNFKTVTMDLTDQEKLDFYKNYKEVKKLNGEVDRARAQQVMSSIIHNLYGDGYTLDGLNYQENTDKNVMWGSKSWSAQFKKAGASEELTERGNISIDPLTEGLISINKYSYADKADSSNSAMTIDYEKAYHKALDAVVKYFPDKVKEIDTYQNRSVNLNESKEVSMRYFNFNFMRTINGIDYANNNIGIELDMKTGEVRGLSKWWSDNITVPEAKNIITSEDAKNIFFENNKPEAYYMAVNKSSDYTKPDYEVKLVYGLADQYMYDVNIDAFSGKRINGQGEEIDDNIEAFMNNIKGSEFEKELSILAYGSVLDTKNFDMKKQATNMDLIKMLVNAKGYRPYLLNNAADLRFSGAAKGDLNYKYLQMAVIYGIVDNKEGSFDSNALVTREQALKSIVKLMGYDKIAKCQGIFTLSFEDSKDIAAEDIGYIAIAQGFGIVKTGTGKLQPKSNINMTELAVDIYRALGVLRSN